MSEKLSGGPEKWSGATNVRELVATVAGPRDWVDNRKTWLSKAARAAGISNRQVKALFYGEITDPNHRSARLMRDAAERLESVAHALEHIDPNFHGPQIDNHRSLAREIRRSVDPTGLADRSGTDPEG